MTKLLFNLQVLAFFVYGLVSGATIADTREQHRQVQYVLTLSLAQLTEQDINRI